ncbi:MAG: hypothetical protein HY835_02725 [Anaerolineae bacterium]|nr:hypothetical protein [Anaerolineae bacterium]
MAAGDYGVGLNLIKEKSHVKEMDFAVSGFVLEFLAVAWWIGLLGNSPESFQNTTYPGRVGFDVPGLPMGLVLVLTV